MSMRVLVTSVGSSPGVDLCRCLGADASLTLIGADASPWGRRIGQRLCAEVVALPRADAGARVYADAVAEAATESRADFVFFALDVEVGAMRAAGSVDLPCPHALPNGPVAPLLDKAALVQHLDDDDSWLPRSAALPAEADEQHCAAALARVGTPAWLRPAVGTSGRGSLAVSDAAEAAVWIEFWRRRGEAGRWLAQEFLPGDNLNVSGVWVDGACVAMATLQRTAYYLETVALSGVTGQVREAVTVRAPEAEAVATAVVRALVPAPHGVFSVDLRGDAAGVPKVTEINPRFAGRPSLSAHAGANLPLAALRALTGREIGDAVTVPGGRPGVRMVRQLDLEPLFEG